jgi:adenylosuccinate lyase
MSAPNDPILPPVTAVFGDDFFRELCFSLWHAHLRWLHTRVGFTDALRKRLRPAPAVPAGGFGHEMVDLLAQFIATTGLVNAHLGLTSSDICDNVRLMQIERATKLLHLGVTQWVLNFPEQLVARLPGRWQTWCAGLTHWQPAAPLSWDHRIRAWVAPFLEYGNQPPIIHAKQFGGPVGDAASLHLLCPGADLVAVLRSFDWEPFGLEPPSSDYPLQSSDHASELRAVQWAVRVGAQLHKVAQDWRVLAALGVVRPAAPAAAGSSSMPGKVNPHRWEKVCGLCRSAATAAAEMWDVAAHNSLERTLDTSWQLKHLLPRCFLTLAEAVDVLAANPAVIDPAGNERLLVEHDAELQRDRALTLRVLKGEDRWSAYLDLLKSATS